MSKAAELLRQLERWVREEAVQQREHLERQWSLPLGERVRRGYAMEGLDYVGFSRSSGNLIFQCGENNSRFREGDILFLHRGNPLVEEVIQMIFEDDQTDYIELSVYNGNLARILDEPHGWVADEGYMDFSGSYLETLREIANRNVGRERVLPLILGEIGPEVNFAAYERGWTAATEIGLNGSQAEAVGQAYATNLVHLIQGPPGTGKTLVLAHIARLLALDGERVFVMGLTHRSIHNALNKISQIAPEVPIAKIGQRSRTDGLKVQNYDNFNQSGFGSLSGGYIIGATPFATRSSRLGEVEFDTVIFDEASQVTLPLALMGMLVGKRYIFIGDDQQLPPVSALSVDSVQRLGLNSIFGYLMGRGYETLLDETYRMNAGLTSWPSHNFYADKLFSAPQVRERRLSLTHMAPRWREILDPVHPAVFVDLYHRNSTTRNYREADLTVDLIAELLQAGLRPGEIGVVVPYRTQGREIRNRLALAIPDATARQELVVDTVERMQGQEREVIIFSMTTSNPTFAAELAGFYFQPQRLNVTITRPRTKLIVVGSSSVLHAQPEKSVDQENLVLFRDFLQSCTLRLSPYEERS